MKTLCLKCLINSAIKHPVLGFLLCNKCQAKSQKLYLPTEFTLASVKESRKEYADDIIQSSKDGVLNKRRLEVYGTRGLKVTEEQVKNARYVFAGEIASEPYRESDGKII